MHNCRMLYRDLLDNLVFFDKIKVGHQVFGGNKNQLVFSETDYDTYVTDIMNQHVKDETGKIKNFCNLRVNVNPERFKIELSKCITPDMNVYKELEDCIFRRQ